MAEDSESEVRGLHALGNPDVEYRSADGGQTGRGPIGNFVAGEILARGVPLASQWAGRRGMADGKEQLRKGPSR
jgi:hypothetical protein